MSEIKKSTEELLKEAEKREQADYIHTIDEIVLSKEKLVDDILASSGKII